VNSPDTLSDSLRQHSLEAQARRRVGVKLGFATHAAVFVLVNAALYLIDRSNGGPNWSQYPLAGWGAGLALHGVVAALVLGGDGWRERMVAREVQRLQDRR